MNFYNWFKRAGQVFGLVSVFWLAAAGPAWAAGSLSLEPSTQTGNQFDVSLVLNTGGQAVVEAQIILDYNPAILEVTNATLNDLFTVKLAPTIDNVNGNLTMLAYMSDEADSYQGEDTLANIQFRGKSLGMSSVTVRCTPQATNDSNLRLAGSSTDILDCGLVINGSYTVSDAAATEVTPTMTPTPIVTLAMTPTPTPTSVAVGSTDGLETTPTPPAELLTTASISPTLTLAMIGSILLLGSLLLFIW